MPISVWNIGSVQIYPHIFHKSKLDVYKLGKNILDKYAANLKATLIDKYSYCSEVNGWNVITIGKYGFHNSKKYSNLVSHLDLTILPPFVLIN